MGYKPIENYGIIGDLETVALVGMNGAIDFMCFPEFDSPTIFGALLDDRKGGSFELSPVLKGARNKQLYLPDSNILLTRFLADGGMAEVSDFMPIAGLGHAHNLVRRAKAIRGDWANRGWIFGEGSGMMSVYAARSRHLHLQDRRGTAGDIV